MRHEVPIDLKYFCMSEAIAFYLQKYVVYRKRKIYAGKQTFSAEALSKVNTILSKALEKVRKIKTCNVFLGRYSRRNPVRK